LNQNWKTNFQEAYKRSVDLYQFLGWDSKLASEVETSYPLFIPKKLAEKIKAQGPDGVLAKEFLPDVRELNTRGMNDPIGDMDFYKAPQLIHRYPSRALFTPTTICPVMCRYCFRKNELHAEEELFQADFEKTVSYLKTHPEITEIIFTGGDPLTLSNEKLTKFLDAFAEISSIKDIRFHTRYPVIMPSRLDEGFFILLQKASKKFRTVSLAVHANHVDEFDEESRQKLSELAQLNIQLLSQTVFLRDVNDSLDALINLMNQFISLKIRPYYLHHPDQVKGGLHFYIPLETGRALYSSLRNHLPGWAVPHYVIDIPGGSGKVGAFNPEAFSFSGQLIGRNGDSVTVQEPDFFGL
jgi:lysine 2,3-aminomutase